MSFAKVCPPRVCPPSFLVVLFLVSLGLCGCYTRQIEGIQSDLDSLDRKLHSINTKGSSTAGSTSKADLARIEDQLNRVTLQQADLKDHVEGLRADQNQLKTDGIPLTAGAGGPSSSEIKGLRKDLESHRKKTDDLDRQVKELKGTFADLKTDTLGLIQMLKEEFGEGEAGTLTTQESVSPPTKSVAEEEVGPVSSAPPEFSGPDQPVTVGKSYRINPGENLSTVAKKFNVKVDTLKQINGIDNPNMVKMGQVIYLP